MDNKNYDEKTQQVIKNMQNTIDDCWEKDDPMGRKFRDELFPNGKPTVGEFLNTLASTCKEDMRKNKKIRIKNILKKILFYLGVTFMIGLLGAFIYSGVYLIIKIHNGTLSESEQNCIEMYKKYLS